MDTPASEREFLENLYELDHKIKFLNLQVRMLLFTLALSPAVLHISHW